MSRILLGGIACALLAIPTVGREDKQIKYYTLVHVESGKVLAIEGDSSEAGSRAVVAKLNEKNQAQQWKVETDGDFFKLANRKSGKVLDVNEDSSDEGAFIIQWDDKGEDNDNQRFKWVEKGEERRLRSRSSGLVIDVDGDGKLVQKKADDKARTQLWKLSEVK